MCPFTEWVQRNAAPLSCPHVATRHTRVTTLRSPAVPGLGCRHPRLSRAPRLGIRLGSAGSSSRAAARSLGVKAAHARRAQRHRAAACVLDVGHHGC
jgi:hypothetical protein